MKFDSLEAFKKHFPIVVEIPVAWGEMDSMQHVNHTVYLKWMETARFEFFEKLGMMELMQETGVGNILKSIECRYSCLLYTSPSPRDLSTSRMPSSA